MKFLEVLSLQKVTSTLQKCDLGDRIIHGRVEAYSCKRAGPDKRLSKEIQRQLAEETTSVSPLATSPLGPLKSSSTRKLLISLITTLNASFPDYDFSNLRSEHFEHEKNVMTAMDNINNLVLNSMEPFHSGFRDEFWSAIDETIELNTCEIYTYVPDADTDVFALGKLWSVNYFFYSKKRKMIVFFTANAVSKLHQHTIKHIHHRRTTTDLSDDDDVDDDGSEDESIDEDDDDLSEDDITEDGEDEYEPRGYVDVQLLDWDEDDIQETGTKSTSTSTSTTVSTTTTPSSITDSTSKRSRSKKSALRKHPRSTPTKSLPIKKSKFTPVDTSSFSPSSTNSSHQIPSFSPIVTSMASDFGGLQTSSPLMKPMTLPSHGHNAPIDFHEHKSIAINDRRP